MVNTMLQPLYQWEKKPGVNVQRPGWVWKILALPKSEPWTKKRYIYKDLRPIRPVKCKDFWVLKAEVCTKHEVPSRKRTKQNTNSGFWYSQRSGWKTDWIKSINSFKSNFLANSAVDSYIGTACHYIRVEKCLLKGITLLTIKVRLTYSNIF